MKKKKLNLSELRVASFITDSSKIKGGGSGLFCANVPATCNRCTGGGGNTQTGTGTNPNPTTTDDPMTTSPDTGTDAPASGVFDNNC